MRQIVEIPLFHRGRLEERINQIEAVTLQTRKWQGT